MDDDDDVPFAELHDLVNLSDLDLSNQSWDASGRPPTFDGEVSCAQNVPKDKKNSVRAYDRERARHTRARNLALRKQGIKPPPPYRPKNATEVVVDGRMVYAGKRKYEPSGKFVGANLKKGGKTRAFSDENAHKYQAAPSKFFTTTSRRRSSDDQQAPARVETRTVAVQTD